jgi:hypothetical protein
MLRGCFGTGISRVCSPITDRFAALRTGGPIGMRPVAIPLKLRVAWWKSSSYLGDVAKCDLARSSEELADRKEFLWNAMLTEYDAKNLSRHLATLNIKFSPEFLSFKRAWSRDEWNHYLGFRRIYSILYEEPEDKIAEQIERDVGNFDLVAQFLNDEFTICLLLAYDEVATLKSYIAEFPFYKALDDRIFHWFQKVTKDELNHFLNCMEIVRCVHDARTAEISGFVDQIMKWDLERHPYGRTFVFDHYWYSLEFLDHCAKLINGYLARGLKGVNFSARIETNDAEAIFKKYIYR